MSFATSLALVAIIACGDAQSNVPPGSVGLDTDPVAEAVTRGGDEVIHLILSSVAPRPTTLGLHVGLLSEQRVPSGSATVPLWYGGLVGPTCADSLSFASDASGSWGIALEVHGGGTRLVYVWRGQGTPLAPPHERGFSIVQQVALENVATADDSGPELLADVFATSIFSDGEDLFLLGSGRGIETRRFMSAADAVVWLARLDEIDFGPVPDDPAAAVRAPSPPHVTWSLGARAIAPGVDPRAVTLASEVVLAVRHPRSTVDRNGVGSLSFFTSSDLVEWTASVELVADLAVTAGYDLAVDDGVLWLAASSSEPPHQPGVLRFDPATSSWEPVAFVEDTPTPAVASARQRLWLVPGPGPRGPLLVYEGADGSLVRRQLP